MSEFKGTKGKWFLEYYKTDNELVVRTPNEWICLINQLKGEYNANALLISKAPEILEMLQKSTEVIKWYMENSTSELSEPFFNIGANQIEQIEQLIKQATEI